MNKLLVISGPTASGKSYLAESLLDRFKNAILLNADSMQVYKELPILSAQPISHMASSPSISSSTLRGDPVQKNSTQRVVPNNKYPFGESFISGSPRSVDDERKVVQYNLYSFLNFYENCSAGIWLKEAERFIEEAFKLGKQPVIVGGTGLYLKALLDGIIEIPDVPNDVKEHIQAKFLKLGKEKFYEELSAVDPISAAKIHPNDSYRMQRSMEVYTQTGQSITSFKTNGKRHEVLHISINPTRETLYKNCDLRFKEMLATGAEQEVRALLEKITNKPGKYNIENTLGYRSLVSHLKGLLSRQDAISEANQATRNYAKRQCTWFRNQFKDKISLQYETTVTEVEAKLLEIVRPLLT